MRPAELHIETLLAKQKPKVNRDVRRHVSSHKGLTDRHPTADLLEALKAADMGPLLKGVFNTSQGAFSAECTLIDLMSSSLPSGQAFL